MTLLLWAVGAVLGAAILVRVLSRGLDFLMRHHVHPIETLPFAFNLRGWERSNAGALPATYVRRAGPAEVALQFSNASEHYRGLPPTEWEHLDVRLVCGALAAKNKPEDLAASLPAEFRLVTASGQQEGLHVRAWIVRRNAEAVLVTLIGEDLSSCEGEVVRKVQSVRLLNLPKATSSSVETRPLQPGPTTARLRLANDMQLRQLQGDVQSEELAPGLHLVYALQGEDRATLENLERSELERIGREQFKTWALQNVQLSRVDLQQIAGELVRNASLVDNASLSLLAPSIQEKLKAVLGDSWLVLLPRHDALLVARDTERNLALLREAAEPLLDAADEHLLSSRIYRVEKGRWSCASD